MHFVLNEKKIYMFLTFRTSLRTHIPPNSTNVQRFGGLYMSNFTISTPNQLTLLEMWESIMKLWTCFSARLSSSFLATTATTRTVQPAPCERHQGTLY